MATILDLLKSAKSKIQASNKTLVITIGLEQLSAAVTLLEKGYSIDDDVDEIIRNVDDLDEVPEKANHDAIEPWEKEGY